MRSSAAPIFGKRLKRGAPAPLFLQKLENSASQISSRIFVDKPYSQAYTAIVTTGHAAKLMIGYCGINCAQCDAFIATKNNDNALRARVAAVWSKLYGAPVLPENINCTGCKSHRQKTYFSEHLCEVKKCATHKSISSCKQCPMCPCALVTHILDEAREAKRMTN